MKADEPIHILEIGFTPLISTHPGYRTTYIETQVGALLVGGRLRKLSTALRQGLRLLRAAADPRLKLLVCRSFSRFIWRRDLSLLTNLVRYFNYWAIRFCVWRCLRRREVRMVVLDWDDESIIFSRDRFLLDGCHLYFKRELPQNAWNVFKYLQPPHLEPIVEFTRSPRFLPRLARLRPVTLGIHPDKVARIERCLQGMGDAPEKAADVFFAGRLHCATVRQDGIRQLQRLRQSGLRVDVPEVDLPFEEFVRRMASAWLVWSPEGGGWDCFRHYEICVAGSVPLMNYPTIQRYQPMLDGVHCVFYGVEGDDLQTKIRTALADKARLRTMGAAARAHVLAHHTYPRLAEYIVETAMAPG